MSGHGSGAKCFCIIIVKSANYGGGTPDPDAAIAQNGSCVGMIGTMVCLD